MAGSRVVVAEEGSVADGSHVGSPITYCPPVESGTDKLKTTLEKG